MKVKRLAEIIGGLVIGDLEKEIYNIAPVECAGELDMSFIANRKYKKFLNYTKAGCVIVDKKLDISSYKNKTFIVCDNAYLSFAKALTIFYGDRKCNSFISEKSSIDKTVSLGRAIYIGDFVVVEQNVTIDDNTCIMPLSYVGENVSIGHNCLIYPNVVILKDTKIGNNVTIHASSVIGSDGFGYVKDESNKHIKIPQIGNVIIEDNVEIGSNVSIDRATLSSTVIKSGVKIDNLVQIAHNVEVGENSIIISQTGISGSTKLGKDVILAGQTGIAGHLNIVDNVIITAKSGVGRNINKSGIYSGVPVYEHSRWLKNSVVVPRMYELYKKIVDLENKVKELESDIHRRD